MLYVNAIGMALCSYWVVKDTTWTWQWWLSGLGLFFNTYAVLVALSKI